MNLWNGIGRLTKNVELKYNSEMAVARFTLAIDDGYGEKKKTNFIPVVVFGKQAENCEKYLAKGRMVAVTGKINTGNYKHKEGHTVYTTDVVADRVEFIDFGEKVAVKSSEKDSEVYPQGFSALDEDVPF